jgi:hypothetical protein
MFQSMVVAVRWTSANTNKPCQRQDRKEGTPCDLGRAETKKRTRYDIRLIWGSVSEYDRTPSGGNHEVTLNEQVFFRKVSFLVSKS